jgi:hypothetical protein
MPGRCPLHRAVRRWWPDGNPLRRPADHAEAAILAVLVGILVVFGPVSMVAAGRAAHQAAAAAQRAGQVGWHQVTAVITADSGYPPLLSFGDLGLVRVSASWTAPDGVRHRGEVPALPGTRAGTTVRMWVDRAGRPTGPPAPAWWATGQGVLAAMLAFAGAVLVLAGAWLAARRWLDRRRLAAWDAAWRSTGPRWTAR